MWFIGVEVEQETSAPPPKKNPGSAPGIRPCPRITSHSPAGGKEFYKKAWCKFLLTSPSSLLKLPIISWWRGYLKMSTKQHPKNIALHNASSSCRLCRSGTGNTAEIFSRSEIYFFLSAAEEICGSPVLELQTFSKLSCRPCERRLTD